MQTCILRNCRLSTVKDKCATEPTPFAYAQNPFFCLIQLMYSRIIKPLVTITTAADDILKYFSKKICPDMSCELSAWQTIHMTCHDFIFSEKKKKKIECRLLQILFCTLQVKATFCLKRLFTTMYVQFCDLLQYQLSDKNVIQF